MFLRKIPVFQWKIIFFQKNNIFSQKLHLKFSDLVFDRGPLMKQELK